jgi:hypothetical protein
MLGAQRVMSCFEPRQNLKWAARKVLCGHSARMQSNPEQPLIPSKETGRCPRTGQLPLLGSSRRRPVEVNQDSPDPEGPS